MTRRTMKVAFSSGNLQYQPSSKTARFAPNQYDVIGSANEAVSDTYTGWIDLFEWGKGDNLAYCYPNATSGNYHQTFTEWGTNIPSSGNAWRTLSKDEWEYLFSKRPQATSLRGFACVNNVNGYILLPDNFAKPSEIIFDVNAKSYTVNTYTAAQWVILQDAGAVFLPCTGYRTYNPSDFTPTVNSAYSARYWSTTAAESKQSAWYMLILPDEEIKTYTTYRSYGCAVRLVKVL